MSSSCAVLNPVHDDAALLSRIPSIFDDRSPESILIYLAIPGSSVIPMRVLESDSISLVKLRIQSFGGFMVKKQKLVFDGRELARNDCLVRDYGVTGGNLLHLVIRLSDIRSISVETLCGKKFHFQVDRCRNIGYIKQQIAKKGKDFNFTDSEDHKLICDGEELDDNQLVNDICKENDSVIHLLISKSSKVRCMPFEKDFELSVVAADKEDAPPLDTLNLLRRTCIEPIATNPKIILPRIISNLIRTVCNGLEKGNTPVMSREGTGGVYFLQDSSGSSYVAVFKPVDEEPMAKNNPRGLPPSPNGEGLKRGTRVGEGAFREVAAYILDHPIGANRRRSFVNGEIGFSGVPPTVMVRCLNEGFNHPDGYGKMDDDDVFKIGSLQMFVKNNGSCEDVGPRAFPVEEVHKIAVLDIRLANTDRHAGNILIRRGEDDGRIELVPIDHGYCLPENFEDCTFEWLYWPQAREPFIPKAVDYVRSLDAEEDIALLELHGWRLSEECARTLRISTMLLKKGVERGMTPHDIGTILCRETLRRESVVEEIVRKASSRAPARRRSWIVSPTSWIDDSTTSWII